MDDPTRWCENDASNGNAPSGAPDPKRGPHSFSFQWKADLQFNAIGSIKRRLGLSIVHESLWRRNHGQLNKAGLTGRVVNALRGFSIVAGLGPENIGDKGLRIAVVQREPA
jgi:hypothetical protein